MENSTKSGVRMFSYYAKIFNKNNSSMIALTCVLILSVLYIYMDMQNFNNQNVKQPRHNKYGFNTDNVTQINRYKTKISKNKENNIYLSLTYDKSPGADFPFIPERFTYDKKSGTKKQNPGNRKTFKIFPYTNVAHGMRWLESGKGLFANCPYSNCEIVNDKNLIGECDAVVLSMPRMKATFQRPRPYLPNQKWVVIGRESPGYGQYQSLSRKGYSFTKFNGQFNATMTYRRSSTIAYPYGLLTRRTVPGEQPKTANKSKLVAWFVSHCETNSKREEYVRELRNYIQVDIYGRCGQLSCPKRREYCYTMLDKDYKFYLSFENNLCEDYVTEKLFKVLNYNIIPVVLGAVNYSQILPAHSYIDVRNFSSPENLAKYLLHLDKNDNLYNEYLEWKSHYTVEAIRGGRSFVCPFCEYLNRYENVTNTVEKLDEFWKGSKQCIGPQKYYNNVFKFH